MSRLILMCPSGRVMTEEETQIVKEKSVEAGLKIIDMETRAQYFQLEGELSDAQRVLEHLPGWTLGTLRTSRKLP